MLNLQSCIKGTPTILDYGSGETSSTVFGTSLIHPNDRLDVHVKSRINRSFGSKLKTDSFHKYKIESTTQLLAWNSVHEERYQISIQEEKVLIKALHRSANLVVKGRFRTTE